MSCLLVSRQSRVRLRVSDWLRLRQGYLLLRNESFSHYITNQLTILFF